MQIVPKKNEHRKYVCKFSFFSDEFPSENVSIYQNLSNIMVHQNSRLCSLCVDFFRKLFFCKINQTADTITTRPIGSETKSPSFNHFPTVNNKRLVHQALHFVITLLGFYLTNPIQKFLFILQ